MKNFKWGVTSFNEKPIYVVLFVSRNKDNKDIPNFVERRESFITHKTVESWELREDFRAFVNKGVYGELSRIYISVNERNGKKIYTELLHFLIDNPDFNLCDIQPKLAGIAAKKENALTHKWMFDFDNNDRDLADKFFDDIMEKEPEMDIEMYPTPHGFAIITSHGFDCRELLAKYPFASLKRDDLLCCDWAKKE